MLTFTPNDPFPCAAGATYDQQKAHAAEVDAWLGLQTSAVESQILMAHQVNQLNIVAAADLNREFWFGKSVQTFSTPYAELREILETIQPQQDETIVDLGAGYGRLAHVIARHFSEVQFIGCELVLERQIEAQRVIELKSLKNCRVVHADASTLDFANSEFVSSVPEFYFMYDFGSRRDVENCVENLKLAARLKPIVVIARGGRSRDIIQRHHAWLSHVVAPLHRDRYSIYRSAER